MKNKSRDGKLYIKVILNKKCKLFDAIYVQMHNFIITWF